MFEREWFSKHYLTANRGVGGLCNLRRMSSSGTFSIRHAEAILKEPRKEAAPKLIRQKTVLLVSWKNWIPTWDVLAVVGLTSGEHVTTELPIDYQLGHQ